MVPTNTESPRGRRTGRREFLSQLSVAAAGSAALMGPAVQAEASNAEPAPQLPSIRIGDHRVSRLFAGWNPIGGYSYLGPHLNQHMKEYYTPEHIVDYLQRCERAGITAHQFSRPEMMADVLRTLRERGAKMKFICLHSGGGQRMPVEKVVELTSPIAMVHHGGATDKLFREGKSQEVHDYVKRSHDAGVMAGVSAHSPDNIKRIADDGWPVDFFMCCFYYLTRTPEELEKMPPVVTEQVGHYSFFSSDPVRMTAVMRQVDQPCLGFKILAAGRKCNNKSMVQEAFKFAFENIKPTDGVIVGMYPRFYDEIRDNAQYARQFGATADT